MSYRLLFGYRHVADVPYCPCGDPGNYMSLEQSTADPLDLLFTCWCGRTMKARMDSPEELSEFLAKQGVDV